MPGRLSADLITPYVATAADEVSSGRGLSDRSLWALADAIEQLQAARETADGVAREAGRTHVSLVPSAVDDSVPFASLVLGADPERTQAATPQEYEQDASASLGRFVADLEMLVKEDTNAARRLQPALERITDRLLEEAS